MIGLSRTAAAAAAAAATPSFGTVSVQLVMLYYS